MLLAGVTCICVFVMPPMGLMIFFVSLASLPFAVIATKVMTSIDTGLANRQLDRGLCPRCDQRMQTNRPDDGIWSCDFCETTFLPDGRIRSEHLVATD